MPSTESRPTAVTLARSARPAVDEWGVYDPEQAGFAALVDRVEEKWRGSADPDTNKMAASMQEANRLAEASTSREARDEYDERMRNEEDQSPVRGSGRSFLP